MAKTKNQLMVEKLREKYPNARIVTEIVQHNEEHCYALFRAEVEGTTVEDGVLISGPKATGWGVATLKSTTFDAQALKYVEMAEDNALLRALINFGIEEIEAPDD